MVATTVWTAPATAAPPTTEDVVLGADGLGVVEFGDEPTEHRRPLLPSWERPPETPVLATPAASSR